MLVCWSGSLSAALTIIEVSVGAGELGPSAGGEQEDQAAVSTSAVSASAVSALEWVTEEDMVGEPKSSANIYIYVCDSMKTRRTKAAPTL